MRYFSMAIACLLMISCNFSDDFNGEITPAIQAPTFDNTPLGQKQKQFFDTYGVRFISDYTHDDVRFDWNNKAIENTAPDVSGFRYTMPDDTYAIEVMDSVKSWVFDVLGKNFIKEYMPVNIYMTDTVCYKTVSGSLLTTWMWTGCIKYNYMMYGNVSWKFDDLKPTRDQAMFTLSLFLEKMLDAGNIELPYEFTQFSAVGYAQISIPHATDPVAMYGFLRFNREGKGVGGATAVWKGMNVLQDFCDFLAFSVFTPEDVKETFYAKNDLIKQKETYVVDYFKSKYGLTFPYRPIN